jgi:hypothetical protein
MKSRDSRVQQTAPLGGCGENAESGRGGVVLALRGAPAPQLVRAFDSR